MNNELQRLRSLMSTESPTYVGRVTSMVASKIYEVSPLDKPGSMVRCTSSEAIMVGSIVFFKEAHISGIAPSGNFTTIEV